MLSISTKFVEIDGSVDVPYRFFMLTPEQSRAARGWLSWSQAELADRAGLSLSAVRDFEKGRHVPIRNNLAAMLRSFESAGLRMKFDESGMATGISRTTEE